MPPGVPARSGAEQRERVLPALLHTHGKAWEKSLWLRGSTARLQEPAGSRGDPASGNRGGKVLCEVQDPGARGSVHVVRTDTQGWPRGSLPPRRGWLPAAGLGRRAGMNARAFAGQLLRAVGRPERTPVPVCT